MCAVAWNVERCEMWNEVVWAVGWNVERWETWNEAVMDVERWAMWNVGRCETR